jgi:hypothetical protein
MRKLLPFLAWLMLALTGWSGAAHATEVAGSVEASWIDVCAHVEGDRDQVPGDTDNGFPHHHASCHGHDVGTPSSSRIIGPAQASEQAFGAGPFPAVSAHDGEQALRPPRA